MSKKHWDDFDDGGEFDSAFDTIGGKSSSFKYAPSCFESHKPIELSAGFGFGKLYGGSCSRPIIKDADVYVGLDSYMKRQSHDFPWNKAKGVGPVEVLFEISDQCAPKSPSEFVKMIAWLKDRLAEGKNVHVGCIGGHGRTGMVLAALVKEITGEVDAITWVREHYCKKAVESDSQVKFLNKNFGIKVVAGSKSHGVLAGTGKRGTSGFNDRYSEYLDGKIVGQRTGRGIGGDSGPKDLPEPNARFIRNKAGDLIGYEGPKVPKRGDKRVIITAKAVRGKNSIW